LPPSRLPLLQSAGMMALSQRFAAGLNALAHEAYIRNYRFRNRLRDGPQEFDSQILLLHIPKCAGVSLREALNVQVPAHKLFCDFADEELAGVKKIAVCTRDPFDRVVSTFHYLRRLSQDHPVLDYLFGLPRPKDFKAFVDSRAFERLEAHHYFFRSQFQYLKGIEKYRDKVVHLRFEHLAEDFRRHFGSEIPKLNATERPADPDIDTLENRQRVRAVYRADYDLLPTLLAELRG
jgi:hypothetical protein